MAGALAGADCGGARRTFSSVRITLASHREQKVASAAAPAALLPVWTGRCATHESGPDRRALALYRPPTFQECPPLARRDTLPISMPPTASTAAGGSLSGPGTRLGQTGRARQRAALAGRGPAWSALHQLRRQHATRARQAGMAIMTARRQEECDLTSTSLRFAPTTTRP